MDDLCEGKLSVKQSRAAVMSGGQPVSLLGLFQVWEKCNLHRNDLRGAVSKQKPTVPRRTSNSLKGYSSLSRLCLLMCVFADCSCSGVYLVSLIYYHLIDCLMLYSAFDCMRSLQLFDSCTNACCTHLSAQSCLCIYFV